MQRSEPTKGPPTLEAMLHAVRPASQRAERAVGLAQVVQRVTGVERPTPKVGRYTLHQRLGAGGMGVVFRAHDPELDRPVAIKILRGTDERADADRLRKEARVLARLSHPNVVTVYDVGETEGASYVAMELVEGRSLREWMQDHAGSWQEVIEVFLQAAHGLMAAHDQGLVHRDFKPENVLIGSDGRVRVVDFGLARHLPTLPATGDIDMAGTPGYLPPELAAGGTPTIAGDQFSFCVALWEALAGGRPWAQAVAPGFRGGQPVPVSQLPPTIPSGVRRVLERGLAADPNERWGSLHELVALLQTPDLRERPGVERVLLGRVERFWVSGVLGDVLRDVPRLTLNLHDENDLVDDGWDGLSLPPGRANQGSDSLLGAFDAADGGLLIAGAPGCGKTTELLLLARDLLARARFDPQEPIPVVLNLSSWGLSRPPFEDWLTEELRDKYSIRPRLARKLVQRGRLLPLLDGLDEVQVDARAACVDAINGFLREHPGPTVVVTRSDDYAQIGARLRLQRAVFIEPLSPGQVEGYLQALGQDGETLARALEGDADLRAMGQTPLMLAILAAAFQGSTTPAADRPAILEAYLQATLDRRGGMESGQRAAMLRGLSWLARCLRRDSQSELWIERMQPSWLDSPWRRAVFWILVVLTVAGTHVGLNVATNVALDGVALGTKTGLSLGLISTPIIFVFTGLDRVRPVAALRWSWRQSLASMPRTLGLGLISGLIFGLLFDLLGGVVLGLSGGVLVGAVSGITLADVGQNSEPNEGIRQSARNAALVFTLVALISGPFHQWVVVPIAEQAVGDLSDVGIIPGWSVLIGTGVFYGLLVGLIRGGVAVIQHGWVRALAVGAGLVPWNLAAFLDRACDRILMRRVGGGYIFIHRTLLEYLAERPDELNGT